LFQILVVSWHLHFTR